ncbi:hypothetical protein SAMN06265795_11595 [Noviherbaspirillum humi]|uniref:Uncharacterized protein n=1 Tax=Noviherbaspirillum humi TaxID=1688639 RepID=A0A239KDD1_9BURK|nr:hypothetical protein SAMN06265795_11595 [Noviherbaspirillum humi]
MNLINDAKAFFTIWGVLGDESIVTILIFLCYLSALIFGLFQKAWNNRLYRIFTLFLLGLIPAFFCVGFYFVSRPPA